MELLDDNKLEITLAADYDTTVNILKLFPQFDTLDFWKNKCNKLYPEKTYFEFFTGPENFLLKERTFVITVDNNTDPVINNYLMEYNSILTEQLKILNTVSSDCLFEHIKINIEKQFIVIRSTDTLSLLFQSDIKDDCYDMIKEDVTLDNTHYLIDMALFKLTNTNIKNIDYEWIHNGKKYDKYFDL